MGAITDKANTRHRLFRTVAVAAVTALVIAAALPKASTGGAVAEGMRDDARTGALKQQQRNTH